MKNQDKGVVRLKHILEAIELIENFTQEMSFDEFSDDLMRQSAVIRQFEIIGEASANLSEELKRSNPNIEWATIKGFRNLLVHEYFRVDVLEVWSTIENDLPILEKQIFCK